MKPVLKGIFTVSLLVCSAVATTPLAADVTLRYGIDVGGEELAFTVQKNGTTNRITAGSGYYAEIGYLRKTPFVDHSNFSSELSFGFKADGLFAGDYEVTTSRYMANFTQYYNRFPVRLGIGSTFHFKHLHNVDMPQLQVNDERINTAFGLLLVADYEASSTHSYGMRLIRMDYTNRGLDFNGNSFGVFAVSRF